MKTLKSLILFVFILNSYNSFAQKDTSSSAGNSPKKIHIAVFDSLRQQDLVNLLKSIFTNNIAEKDTAQKHNVQFSLVPAIGYSLSTGFAFDITANVAFYAKGDHENNLSSIDGVLVYDTQNQKIFASRSEIWFAKNKFKFITDLRVEQYPVNTYGLGTTATTKTANTIDYQYLRSYLTLLKRITGAIYAGVGYNYDNHNSITESGNADKSESDFDKYGFSNQSISSGISLTLLFDNRRNHINPQNGGYASLTYRDNFKFLGSDNHWQSWQVDLRKYFKLSSHSNNILAFWGIANFTYGNAPYLDLPATETDTYHNSGRGYTAQRFRGKNELYFEAEYRFGISRNGLIGGVVFSNFESFSEFKTNNFVKIAPAAGAGIRIKINKESNTNLGVDYAYGIYNSRGLFVTLGEYF